MSLNTTNDAGAQAASQTLQLPTDGATVKDYASNLHFALCELLRLVFEHRELDLEEDPIYALNIITRLLGDLAGIIADPDGEEDERIRKAVAKLRERFPAKGDDAPTA